MNKAICIILSIIIIGSMSACKQTPDNEISEDILSQVYRVDTSLGSDKAGDENTNTTADGRIITIEKEVGAKTVFEFLENDLTITYQETQFIPDGDVKIHKYAIDGTEKGQVSLYEDGTFQQIFWSELQLLDITPMESPESVEEKIKAELDGFVDFSAYEYCDMYADLNADGTYRKYSYCCRNQVNGFTTNMVQIYITGEGVLLGLQYNYPKPELTAQDLQISDSLAENILQMKIKSVYDTEETRFLSYKLDSDRTMLTMYKGEVCVSYSVVVTYEKSDATEEKGWGEMYLIPLRLINRSYSSK